MATSSTPAHTINGWSKQDTHCVLCLRPFPTDAEIERHAEMECDPDPCWCWSFCWVTQGGECIAEMSQDPIELVMALRGALEAAGGGDGPAGGS